ncbi:hypothetical protein ACSNOK_28245, partial [Streptomyces sp. URMC 126]
MAFTTTAGARGGPRRRALLTGAAVLLGGAPLFTACAGGPEDDDRARAGARLRAEAGRASAALLARYDATLAAHGGLAPRLRPLRAETLRHAEAFGAGPSAPPPGA